MSGSKLFVRANIDYYHRAFLDQARKLDAANGFLIIERKKVLPNEIPKLGNIRFCNCPQRGYCMQHFFIREPINYLFTAPFRRHASKPAQQLQVLRSVCNRLPGKCCKILDRSWPLRQTLDQFEPMRMPQTTPYLRGPGE